jgi:hypothetical protein
MEVIDWVCLAQDSDKWRALVNVEINLWVPSKAVRFFSGCTNSDLYHSFELHRVSWRNYYGDFGRRWVVLSLMWHFRLRLY